ncbi:MAG: SpoIIE family protein phosphatase [Christensenellales bacterium]|nr:SpoIIE family protein phosphatase [Christensenellales bacterium]
MSRNKKIAHSFQRWLMGLVLVAFIVTTAFLWITQTQLSIRNAMNLLSLNISDVRQDILDASDKSILSLAREVAVYLDNKDSITSDELVRLTVKHNLSEINYINSDGIVAATTLPSFMDYDMASGDQSAEFLCLLDDQEEYVQSYQPISFDSSISRKYGGVALNKGGFIQIGYNAKRFQQAIGEFIVGITANRHVGEGGSIIVADVKNLIVSDRHGYSGFDLSATGIVLNKTLIAPGELFESTVLGVECFCMYQVSESYTIVAMIPRSEIALSRNISVGILTVMEILVFVSLFVLIYFLIRKQIVTNILKINSSLSKISSGNLSVVVDVRSHEEFSSLSDDINTTVNTLKRYIHDAAARIDAELAFAKSIQHCALPSVLHPYQNRKDINVWASMHTAKEVGGDFYDFYFINDDEFAFSVADVSGKGIPAAMFMMTSKTLLKSYAEGGMRVDEVFTHANEKLCENNEAGMFVTVWMGIINTRTGMVSYCNAGHNPPLIRHYNGSFTYLKSTPDFVLAGMDGVTYRMQKFQLVPGDIIYLYTDGVTEATNSNFELYGEQRLQSALNNCANATPRVICDFVKADVDEFVGEAPQLDDTTMLCLSYLGLST